MKAWPWLRIGLLAGLLLAIVVAVAFRDRIARSRWSVILTADPGLPRDCCSSADSRRSSSCARA